MCLRELSGSKFHSVTSSNVILYNDVKTKFSPKVDLSGFENKLFNIIDAYLSYRLIPGILGFFPCTSPYQGADEKPESNMFPACSNFKLENWDGWRRSIFWPF